MAVVLKESKILKLTTDGQLGTARDELQEASPSIFGKLAHDLEQVAHTLAVEVVAVIGLDGIHKSLQAPVFFNATEEHDQLIRGESLESSVREDLAETSAESIDLTLHTRSEGDFHDLTDVAAHILDSDVDIGASDLASPHDIVGERHATDADADTSSARGFTGEHDKSVAAHDESISWISCKSSYCDICSEATA